jgi:hypothetical protein
LTGGHAAFAPAGGGGGAAVTFDPSNNFLALSGGNLIATEGASGWQSVRGTVSQTTGKYYAEFDLSGGAASSIYGVVEASAALNIYAGSGTDSIGNNEGSVYQNGSVIATTQSSGSLPVTWQMAVDVGAGLIWWNMNNGNWNNSGTADPATGAGGISMSLSGALFPALSIFNPSSVQNTVNFGATSYVFTPPSGFGNW